MLEQQCYIVNSAFNSQKVVYLQASLRALDKQTNLTYPFTKVKQLINDLECLQCAFGLQLYLRQNESIKNQRA